MSVRDNAGQMRESATEVLDEIRQLKESLGGNVLIAAHHYQREEIVRMADAVGDSYRLAVIASESDADVIIMCGVRFMAESAAILARSDQRVLLPDFDAGCPMADMTTRVAAERALDAIKAQTGTEAVPLTYMNSWADLKALTGERGGSICTSGNAKKIMAHYLDAGKNILFMPDRNLGINTARALGVPDHEIALVSAQGEVPADSAEKRIFLWDGFCPVHREFTAEQTAVLRVEHPDIQIMVHPECTEDVVASSDSAASTEGMARDIERAGAGAVLGVGTEYRFVERMIREYPDRTIVPLHTAYCSDMDLIAPEKLLQVLRGVAGGDTDRFLVTIDDQGREDARRALAQMIAITENS